jgi:hypothetical protein
MFTYTCTNGNSAVLHKEGGVTLAEASENAMQSNAGTRRLVKRPANKSPFRIGTLQLLSCKHVLVILFVLLALGVRKLLTRFSHTVHVDKV